MTSQSKPLVLRCIHALEDGVLITLTLGLLGLAVAQIVMRNGFDSGIYWIDPALRAMVFWLALVGAMIATREKGHIAIDAVLYYLSEGLRNWVTRFVSLLGAVICLIAAWYALDFVRDEMEYGGDAFAQIPAWWVESIMPIALGVIGLRLLIQVVYPRVDTE